MLSKSETSECGLNKKTRLKSRNRGDEKVEDNKVNNNADDVLKRVENFISRQDDVDFNVKTKAFQLSPEITMSSIVRELVFHDKVSFKIL